MQSVFGFTWYWSLRTAPSSRLSELSDPVLMKASRYAWAIADLLSNFFASKPGMALLARSVRSFSGRLAKAFTVEGSAALGFQSRLVTWSRGRMRSVGSRWHCRHHAMFMGLA